MLSKLIKRTGQNLGALSLLAVFMFAAAPGFAAAQTGNAAAETGQDTGYEFQTPSINGNPQGSASESPFDPATADLGKPPADLDCDPLPVDDLNELNECAYWLSFLPIQTKSEYGAPDNPVVLNAMGTRGIAGAYNSTDNTYLIVAQDFTGGVQNGQIAGNSQLVGVIVNAETNAVIKDKFVINQGGGDQGAPLVVYNPDKNEFLVAWEDSRGNDKARFNYARVVNGDGSMPNNDFVLRNGTSAFLDDLDYDAANKRYVVTSETIPDSHPYIQVINEDGSTAAVDMGQRPNNYEGQVSLAVNPDTNEYWVTYVLGLDYAPANPGLRKEDNRIMMMKVDANTLTAKAEDPILLNVPNPGYLAIGGPDIAYDPSNKEAVVIWQDYDKAGVVARTVSNSGEVGPLALILTPQSDPSSDFFGSGVINYNPYTEMFYVSALDNNGGTMLISTVGTTVIERQQPVAPSTERGFNGQFNPTSFVTPTGAMALSSTNYGSVKMGTIMNPKVFPATPAVPGGEPPAVDVTDPQAIGKLVSQIYLWSLGVGGVLALLMIVLGGYRVLTAAGNAAQATSGKEYIYSSLIGLGILFASYLILSTINPDLTRFDLSSLTGLVNK